MPLVGSTVTPLATTFAILSASDSPRVTSLLISALEVPSPQVQMAAAEAILRRQHLQPRLELLRQIKGLPDSVRQLVARSGAQLDSTFRQLLLKGSSESRLIALQAIHYARLTGPVGYLCEMLWRPPTSEAEQVAETLRFAVETVFDQWQLEVGHHSDGSDPSHGTRTLILQHLERAIGRWESLTYRELVVELILMLGDPSHPAVKIVLWHGCDECRAIAADLLMESRHPGIVRLVAECLTEPYPHPKVFEAIRTRQDPEFLAALLRIVSRRRSSQQLHHLRQFQSLSFLEPPFDLLESIPPALQPALIPFVNATRVPRDIKLGVQEWLLRYGTPEAKCAATEGMTLLDESLIQEVVRESLESADASVQAWATSNLRQYAIPEAYTLLVDRLDSPLQSVQEAARNELAGFSVARVLPLADELSVDDAIRAGLLLMKVDLDAVAKLRRELSQPARQKRIKAARRVARLGLQSRFLSAFVLLAQDSDPIARRAAAEILATIDHQDARRTLEQMQDDAHPRVRDSAAQSLALWHERFGLLNSFGGDEPDESLSRSPGW